MKHRSPHSAAALALLVVACAGATGDQEAREQQAPAPDPAASAAIEAAGARLLDAYLAGDLEGWLEGFSDDVVLLPAGAPMIVGTDALREASRIQFGLLESFETEIRTEPQEIEVTGDWAYVLESFEIRLTPLAGGDPVVEQRRLLTIWRRQADGLWKISRGMTNRPLHLPG